jgi:methionyl-tRNA formyltransferase
MKVIVIGEESAGVQVLRALQQTSHDIVAVLSSPSKIANSGASVWNAASRLGLNTWPSELVKDPQLAERLRAERVDIILNVHSLYIIHSAVLKAPSIGAFNLHPGPLPRYAGLNAVSWAIYRGETTHGVTLHRMAPEIDTGAVVFQTQFPIEDGDSALSLSAKCVKEGLVLVQRLLDVAEKDPSLIPSIPQDLSKREYFGRQVPENGRLSWFWPAAKVVNFVRACNYFPFRSPWGCPLTDLGETKVGLAKASRTRIPCNAIPGTVGQALGDNVLIACEDEWVSVEKLKIGKDYVSPFQVLRTGQRLVTQVSVD